MPLNNLPFKDARGKWWIYRNDDDRRSPTPMGPFLTPEYAHESEFFARLESAPLPAQLAHPLMPVWAPAATLYEFEKVRVARLKGITSYRGLAV